MEDNKEYDVNISEDIINSYSSILTSTSETQESNIEDNADESDEYLSRVTGKIAHVNADKKGLTIKGLLNDESGKEIDIFIPRKELVKALANLM